MPDEITTAAIDTSWGGEIDLGDVIDEGAEPIGPELDAPEQEPEAAPEADAGEIELKHLGQVHRVSLDEARTLAQKGMDYDRIRERHDRLLSERGLPLPNQEEARREEIRSFVQSYPEVDPKNIPQEVWQGVAQGGSLLTEYARYENRLLKLELSTLRQNQAIRGLSAGSRQTAGSAAKSDPYDEYWYDEE